MKPSKKMHYLVLAALISFTFNSCELFQSSVQIEFEHFWDEERIGPGNLNITEFVTESGETIIIDDIHYIISEIQLKRQGRNEIYTLSEFQFAKHLNRWFVSISDIPHDDYEITFVFGLRPELNVQNSNLNLPDSFQVPQELGGGYNFMQLDGRYEDSMNELQPFEFHISSAVDISNPNNVQIENTSFEVSLGTHFLSGGPFLSAVDVKVNIAEWFRNPNTWNFSELNSDLTTNYDAQIQMQENGQAVFTLSTVYSD